MLNIVGCALIVPFRLDQQRVLPLSRLWTAHLFFQRSQCLQKCLFSVEIIWLVNRVFQFYPTFQIYKLLWSSLNWFKSIPCVYRASPEGAAYWSDAAGNRLPTRGRIRDEDGTLKIDNALNGKHLFGLHGITKFWFCRRRWSFFLYSK